MTFGKKIVLDESLATRFWAKVDRSGPGGCWIWTGGRQRGYGIIWGSNHGKPYLAHRVSWFIQNHEDPLEMCVLHHCDNPPCVNPDHLYLGTRADNVLDMMRRGRHAALSGENNSNAKLTDAQLFQVWTLATSGAVKQRDIGNKFGVSESHVRAIKAGRIRKNTIDACLEFTEGDGL